MPYGLEQDNRLVNAFLAARDMKMREARNDLESEQLRVRAQREAQLPEAIRLAEAGDPTMLLAVNPEMYQQRAQQLAGAAESERKRKANVAQYITQGIASGQPIEWAEGLARRYGIDTQNMGAYAAAELGAPKPAEREKPGEWIRNYMYLHQDDSPDKPGFAERATRWERENRKSGAATTNIGDAALGLSKEQISKQQGEVIGAKLQLDQFANMRKTIEDAGGYEDIAGFTNRLKSGAIEFAGRLDPRLVSEKQAEWSARRTMAIASMGEFVNTVISKRGGANVPPAELERLTESLPRPTDYGPVLKAKIDFWEKNLRLVEQAGVATLIDGIKAGRINLPGETEESWDHLSDSQLEEIAARGGQ